MHQASHAHPNAPGPPQLRRTRHTYRVRSSSRSGLPPSMKTRPPGARAGRMRASTLRSVSGWRPSSAPTRTASTMSNGSSSGSMTKDSASTWRTLIRPDSISSRDPARACATALADRSIATTRPVRRRRAISRAAAPGPHPISSTWQSGVSGRASTMAASRGDRAGLMPTTISALRGWLGRRVSPRIGRNDPPAGGVACHGPVRPGPGEGGQHRRHPKSDG